MASEDREILFAIIDRETREYRLLDQNNNVVYRYKNGDVLVRNISDEPYWKVKLDEERFRFNIVRYNKNEETKRVLLPTRTLLLWAVTDDAMYDNPFYYVPKYDNCLEKYLVFRRIPKSVIKKNVRFTGSSSIKYQIFYKDNNELDRIELYTNDMKIFKEIVSELKSKEKERVR